MSRCGLPLSEAVAFLVYFLSITLGEDKSQMSEKAKEIEREVCVRLGRSNTVTIFRVACL
jgi:hypothetical protein